jgi:hypothetical protein
VRAEGGEMLPSALDRLVASAEAWLKRRRRAREDRRRDQSCLRVGRERERLVRCEERNGGVAAWHDTCV